MMMHPASIQARAGAVLAMIERNVEQQDLPGLVNFVKLLQVYCVGYLEDEVDLKEEIEAIPAFDYDKGSEDWLFDNEMKRLSILVRLLKKHNIMGYGTVQIGDSSALEDEVEAV